jgi:hypothetical protein
VHEHAAHAVELGRSYDLPVCSSKRMGARWLGACRDAVGMGVRIVPAKSQSMDPHITRGEDASVQRGESSFGHRARLKDDDRRLVRASCSVAIEVLVQFAPALPQPFTLLADRGPAEHLAPDPTG